MGAPHRALQRERGRAGDRAALDAFQAGSDESRAAGDRRFRTLVEQVRDYAIFMADPEGRPTTWNEGVKRLLGYEEHEFLGQLADALFTPEDRARGVPQLEFRTAAAEAVPPMTGGWCERMAAASGPKESRRG